MQTPTPEIMELRRAIETAVQHTMKTPADFDFLASVIWERSKNTISATTLKRLWSYIDGYNTVRASTLRILSRFLGFNEWEDFLADIEHQNNIQSNFILTESINSNTLTKGALLELAWLPNRVIVIEYLGNNSFVVKKSLHSKLQVGDTFNCAHFILNHPLYIDNLVQNDQSPVAYVMGKKEGIITCKILNNK